MENIYELENELLYMQTSIIQGSLLNSLEISNNNKEKVLRILHEKLYELEKDKDNNFLAIETIKLFVEENFKERADEY